MLILEEQGILQPLSRAQVDRNEALVARYQAGVTAHAATWLKGRGLGREEAALHRLGVVNNPDPEHRRYAGWLSIPYLSPSGEALGLRFRCLEDHDHREHNHGKYMSETGARSRIYNLAAVVKASDSIAIAEGEFDAIVLNKVGIPAVAVPGASLWRPHYRRIFSGFSDIVVFADPDKAGGALAAKICQALRNARVVSLPNGDVNETYLEGGAKALLELSKWKG